jgi:hypothetical protein
VRDTDEVLWFHNPMVARSTFTRGEDGKPIPGAIGVGWRDLAGNVYRTPDGRDLNTDEPAPKKCFNCNELQWNKDRHWQLNCPDRLLFGATAVAKLKAEGAAARRAYCGTCFSA